MKRIKPVLVQVSGGVAEIVNASGEELCEIRDLDNEDDEFTKDEIRAAETAALVLLDRQ